MAVVNFRIEDSLSIDYLLTNLKSSFLLIIKLIKQFIMKRFFESF